MKAAPHKRRDRPTDREPRESVLSTRFYGWLKTSILGAAFNLIKKNFSADNFSVGPAQFRRKPMFSPYIVIFFKNEIYRPQVLVESVKPQVSSTIGK